MGEWTCITKQFRKTNVHFSTYSRNVRNSIDTIVIRASEPASELPIRSTYTPLGSQNNARSQANTPRRAPGPARGEHRMADPPCPACHAPGSESPKWPLTLSYFTNEVNNLMSTAYEHLSTSIPDVHCLLWLAVFPWCLYPLVIIVE